VSGRARCGHRGCGQRATEGDYVSAYLTAKGTLGSRSGRFCEKHGEAVLEQGGRWYPEGDGSARPHAERTVKPSERRVAAKKAAKRAKKAAKRAARSKVPTGRRRRKKRA